MAFDERDMVDAVRSHLMSRGYEVFHEVFRGKESTLSRADTVAVKEGEVMVVETKTQLSLALLGQAKRWTPYANTVVAVYPKPKRDYAANEAANDFAAAFGLGMWRFEDFVVKPVVEPVFNAEADVEELLQNCHDKTSVQTGGARHDSYWTPFRDTAENILALLKANPRGLTTKHIVVQVEHHYKTDRSAETSLPRWFDEGLIPGVERVPGTNPIRWRLKQ